MGDRHLLSALCASLAIHLSLLIAVTTLAQVNRSAPVAISVRLVEVPASESGPQPITSPPSKPQAQKIIAPKLLSKPEITAEPSVKPGNVKEEIKEPVEPIAQFAPLPQTAGSPTGGWNFGGKPGEAEGARAGGGNASVAGNVAAGIGTEGTGGGGGSGLWGLGRGYKGDGTGGGEIAADALAGLARPMGGYQVKPRYPDSARRAGFQGTTLLKVHVLENGRVGEVLIEQSAGHRDLDAAAA
ncbi:MAG TPA: TonB family protein, partial [Terriglobales bacterium]|nr:TonB family protein [Terriglobales bacterium]